MAVAIGEGGSAGSCRRWRRSEWSAVVAGAGRCSDGGSGCEQVRMARAAVAQAGLGIGRAAAVQGCGEPGLGCSSRTVGRLGKPGLSTAGEGRR